MLIFLRAQYMLAPDAASPHMMSFRDEPRMPAQDPANGRGDEIGWRRRARRQRASASMLQQQRGGALGSPCQIITTCAYAAARKMFPTLRPWTPKCSVEPSRPRSACDRIMPTTCTRARAGAAARRKRSARDGDREVHVPGLGLDGRSVDRRVERGRRHADPDHSPRNADVAHSSRRWKRRRQSPAAIRSAPEARGAVVVSEVSDTGTALRKSPSALFEAFQGSTRRAVGSPAIDADWPRHAEDIKLVEGTSAPRSFAITKSPSASNSAATRVTE